MGLEVAPVSISIGSLLIEGIFPTIWGWTFTFISMSSEIGQIP